MRVLVPVPDQGSGWLGGSNYFRSLLQALRAHPDANGGELVVLCNRPEVLADCIGGAVQVHRADWLNPRSRADYLLNDASNSLLNFNPLLDLEARRRGADLITHAAAGRGAPCPVLHWVPDFQHRHLPDFFSAYERWRRDRQLRAAATAGHLLVSSEAAAADFRAFFPRQAAYTQVHVLPFLPVLQTDAEAGGSDTAEVCRRHGIYGPFFFLPNQFWRHKNHRVVVKALRQLPAQFQVVSTGAIADRRGSQHIRELLAEVEKGALQHRFRMLGVVPREDLLKLMRASTCVINPSLFEGWSTVVEEAKYLGKNLILSDIPVHREQNAEAAHYFPPHDADALAVAMQVVLASPGPEAEAGRAAAMRVRFAAGVPAFAARYWNICRQVAGRD